MISVDLNDLELTEFFGQVHKTQHTYATFPLFSVHGTETSSTVYFELDPGDSLGWHTDSEEEVLLILAGDVEVSVEAEKAVLQAQQLALVPKLARHNLRNVGDSKVRVLGFFGARDFLSEFDEAWLPTESRFVDTAEIAAEAAGD